MEAARSRTDVDFAILGPPEARRDGEPVEITGQRLRTLLGLLILDAGRVVPVDRLIAGIWDDRMPSGVGNALQALVSRLRAALGKISARQIVVAEPAGYRLAVEPDRVDAYRFTALADRGQAALAAGDAAMAAGMLHEALSLWRGPALAGLRGDLIAAGAARLESRRLAATEDRIEADLRLGRTTGLAEELTGLLAAHPLRERLHALRMRVLYESGRRVEALAAYEAARRAFRDELGADPSPSLAALHLEILRDPAPPAGHLTPSPSAQHPLGPSPAATPAATPADHPHASLAEHPPATPAAHRPAPPGEHLPVTSTEHPHATSANQPQPHAGLAPADEARPRRDTGDPVPARRGNLRARLTSFVGREEDLRHTARLLSAHRLVTLVGPGGAGKTRLALEVADAAAPGTPDGVWVAELAAARDAAGVAQSLISALEVRDALLASVAGPAPPMDPVDRLAAALRDRRPLIVLDNCEHVVEHAARLADRLLADCPGVRVLATSREPLGITGEVTWALPPLGLPPAGATAGEAAAYPAVRLFAERAAAVRPGYEIGEDAAAVVAICRALDGLPLAIELAAARLRSLSAEEIAARLAARTDRFALLGSGSRIAQPRHQTLRAVVEWSWNLLDEQERQLGRRLSVFAGGATLAMIERLYGDVLGPLSRLVDKSLVVFDGRRYRMLETIRAYAAERLAESGEAEQAREAHARAFAELAETAEPGLRTAEQLDRMALLDAESENLSAALHWAVGAGAGELALRLVGALGWYWWLRGRRAEAGTRAREALAAAGKDVDGPVRALALAVYALAGIGAFLTWEEGREALREMRACKGDAPAHPLVTLAGPLFVIHGGGGVREDRALVEEMDRHADPWVVATGQLLRALVGYADGRIAEAEQAATEALGGYRATGDRWGTATALAALSDVHFLRGEPERALDVMREAVTLVDALGSLEDTTYMRARMALGLNLIGRRQEAENLLHELTGVVRAQGDRIGEAGMVAAWGELRRQDGDLEGARESFTRALEIMDRAPGVPIQMASAVNCSLGLLGVREGDLPRARRLLALALELAMEAHDAQCIGITVIAAADLALAAGRPHDAAALLGGAETVKGVSAVVDHDHVRVTAETRAALGDAEFTRHLGRGRTMTRDEIVTLALSV